MKKKLVSVLLAASLLLPSAAFAAPSPSELNPFLNELGWSQAEMEEYLNSYDYTLDEYENLKELKEFLGPVLTEENLAELLADYELSLEEATELLLTNGEMEEGGTILGSFTFLDDIEFALAYYDLTPISQAELDRLLLEYDLSLEDLQALLAENEDSLEDYAYIEDLDWALYTYLYESDEELAELEELFNQIGFTEEELENLYNHFLALEIENPAFFDEMDEIASRMVAFEDLDGTTELTEAQIAELLDLNRQILTILQLDISYSLVKGDEQKKLSIENLLALETTDGYSLLIELHNKEGQFLADMLLTADMLVSELITETGKDLKETKEIITAEPEAKPELVKEPAAEQEVLPDLIKKPAKELELDPETKLGGKLPDTATDYLTGIAAGSGMILAGLFIYRRFNWRRH